MKNDVLFVQGNEACVRGALYAGLDFFAGYPITPSTEIADTLLAGIDGRLSVERIEYGGKQILYAFVVS